MLRVGLTGGIGSGKTTVAQFFTELGTPVIDTDELAREVVRQNAPAHTEIVQRFGADILGADGALDRARMRALVFSDPLKRKALEAILHPRIREGVRKRLAELDAPYVIIAVPLLVETGFDDLVDRILVVDCDEALQIRRVNARSGLTEDEVRRVMAAQISRTERLAHADDVLENNSDRMQLQEGVNNLHERYLALGRN